MDHHDIDDPQPGWNPVPGTDSFAYWDGNEFTRVGYWAGNHWEYVSGDPDHPHTETPTPEGHASPSLRARRRRQHVRLATAIWAICTLATGAMLVSVNAMLASRPPCDASASTMRWERVLLTSWLALPLLALVGFGALLRAAQPQRSMQSQPDHVVTITASLILAAAVAVDVIVFVNLLGQAAEAVGSC